MSKVLVICQYYYPEPVRITDICEELVREGHEVDVVTDIPNYPMGNYYDDYSIRKNRNQTINGVNIHRCYTIPRKNSHIMRLLNYHSFSFFSKQYIKRIKKKYDVVFVNQLSPVMMANAAIKYKKKYNIPVVLYCLDLWPESLSAGGIKKNSLIYRIYYRISKKIYEKVDKILVTSESFKNYFSTNFNINTEEIQYLPQYAEAIFKPTKNKNQKKDTIDLVFAGNIGRAQSLDTIIDAAELLKSEKKLIWHIIGDGQELHNIQEKIKKKKLHNIITYGRKPLEEMPKYYDMADAMIVTLCGESLISNTLPGKVQSYMAAGKPILAAANGETKKVILDSHSGYCSPADDAEQFANIVKEFMNLPNKEELGKNSYNYYKKCFSKEIFMKSLNKYLKTEE